MEDASMKEVNVITLNNIDYIIIDEITIEGVTYIYLVNENDDNDFLIQKLKLKDGQNYLTNLANREEYNLALIAFENKNKQA